MKTLLLSLATGLPGSLGAAFGVEGNDTDTGAPVALDTPGEPGEPGPLDPAAAATLQIHAKSIVLPDGSRVEGVLTVAEGKIQRVTAQGAVDARMPVVEHDGFLTPGFVACQGLTGTGGEASDFTRTFLPEAHLAHAFVPRKSAFERALAAGITSIVLAPEDVALVGGQTAVVKTSGGTVVADGAHLALSFSSGALSQTPEGRPRFFFFAAEDGGPERTDLSSRGSRGPTSYGGALRALEARFAASKGKDDVFGRAGRGELPVWIEAWDRNEVARAANFSREHGLKGALRGAPLAGDPGLLPLLQSSGLGVVMGPFHTGHRTRSLASVATLQAANVPVAFALGSEDDDPRGLRMTAALALSAGADAKMLLGSLTTEAAKLAGVADRVGSLAAGMDADFVLWSGDPLNLSSRVVAVYVDGDLAWSASEEHGAH